MSDSILCQVERIDGQLKQAELYALWWMARVTSGEIKEESLFDGEGNKISDEKKIQDAIRTANTHIKRIEDLVEKKIELMKLLHG